MSLNPSEFFTYQFYTWEYRGRGWLLADLPIQLEPPFIPFIRHLPQPSNIDDGKRPTLISSFIEKIKGKKIPEKDIEDEIVLDYEELEPFADEDETKLTAIQIKHPKERDITPERMKALLTMLSYNQAPVSFEIIGNEKEIIIQFVCRSNVASILQVQIKAYFPELIVLVSEAFQENLFQPDLPTSVTDFGLKEEFFRPLSSTKNFKIDPLTGLFGVLENLSGKMLGGIQILFSGTINSWSDSIIHSVTLSDGSSFFEDAPESPKIAIDKISSPLLGVTIRAFAQGKTKEEAEEVLEDISLSLINASAGNFNSLIPLITRDYDFKTRVYDICLRTSHRLGMILNTDELVNLLHFPSEQIQSRKLLGITRKTKEIPAIAKEKDFVLGINSHNGVTQNASIGVVERLKHTHIIGATGTGKSTLLLSMIAQDVEQGNGVAVLDPHGDLIESILTTIPENRIQDVIVIDPADSEYPIGFNILQAYSDVEKEILASDLVAAFKRNSTSWGDQMNSVFGNAIIAFLESKNGGTLTDLRRFLIEKNYRQEFLKTVNDPSIRYYWEKEYPLLKTNSIGPILTRLDTFLRPRLIRNMVCQKKSLNFESILDSQKILLVKLSQGLIGIENSYLLGSFVVAKIHQAALARQARQLRNNFFFYIDEFQHFITPSMAGILSGARKYHLGLILAHQDLQQLSKSDSEIASSVITNACTRICFRIGEIDAKQLADGFAFFEANDLQNLDTGEAIVRIERPEFDFSLGTIPIQQKDQPTNLKDRILNYSRTNYATPRINIEKELAISLDVPQVEKNQETKSLPEVDEIILPDYDEVKQAKSKQKAELSVPVSETRVLEKEIEEIKEKDISNKEESQHRYLQMLIKKMAESQGFKASIEAVTPDKNGKVDVLMERDDIQIACEVSVTTDINWEIHNIKKCIAAGYGLVVSCMNEGKSVEFMVKKVKETFTDEEIKRIKVMELKEFLHFLNDSSSSSIPIEKTMKGFRVKVSYDSLTNEEMKRKKDSISRIVMDSIRKKK